MLIILYDHNNDHYAVSIIIIIMLIVIKTQSYSCYNIVSEIASTLKLIFVRNVTLFLYILYNNQYIDEKTVFSGDSNDLYQHTMSLIKYS